jgi:PEGA domain-containing protein
MTHRLLARLRPHGAEDRGAAIRACLIYQIVYDTRSSEQEEPDCSRYSEPVPVTEQSHTQAVRRAAAALRRSLAARTAARLRSFAGLSPSTRMIVRRSRLRLGHAVAVLLLAVMAGITVVTAHRLLEVTPAASAPRESAAALLESPVHVTEDTSSTDSPPVATAITKRAPEAFGPATVTTPQMPARLIAQRPLPSPAVPSKPLPSIAQSSQRAAASQTGSAPLPNERATSRARGVPVLGTVLSVTSEPSGAEVYVDGRKLFGRTPMAVSGLSAGHHAVRLAVDGYSGWSENVQLVSDQTTRISVRMQSAGK